MSTEEFRTAMFALGAYVKGFNRRAEIAEQRGGFRVLGRKPQLDDPNVYSFFLDFFDLERRVSVNLPAGHALYPATVPVPHDAGPGYPPVWSRMPLNAPSFGCGEIRSWERN
ncbi:hypothetical protein OH76DRAFT_1488556 [Lentinus brumalis]|uniref:Uncharacterized protein n=1 Tax=Lentinus brumalis TaxID=2498619 RepID=A0A371CQM5_9APHY|nr:hypothetical protein OH76DRAFT_1488556 [Polyporus brumalis]